MNAGAYGGEMAQVVHSVTVVGRNGETLELDNATLEFGYRTSTLKRNAFTVTQVVFELEEGKMEEIRAKMEELAAKRRDKQPLDIPVRAVPLSGRRIFRRRADYEGRASRVSDWRRKSVRQALRFYHQHRKSHCLRYPGFDLRGSGACERLFWRESGAGDCIFREILGFMRFVIVTGMSGGGKSTALKMLEDAGFYCVDNLPVSLIETFVELIVTPNSETNR